MRVLWFTNCLVTQACNAFGIRQEYHGGGWMGALLDALSTAHPGLEICVASADSVREEQRARQGNVEFVRFPCRKALAHAVRVAGEFAPDVVHIHGSEMFYSQIASVAELAPKVVASIQGLVGPCATWPAWFGIHTPMQIIRMHRPLEVLVGRGVLPGYYRFRRGIAAERRMLCGLRHVMGRTDFDRAYVKAANPAIKYHHVGELLRTPFWARRWDLRECVRNSIIFTNAGHPRKGVEILLEAFRIVRNEIPEATLSVAGAVSTRSGYGRLVRRALASTPSVRLLGVLDGPAMAEALAKSHVFVSPSFIDNSPNAVCEAQLIGMPVVATYVGGVPSLIEDRVTGLLTPAGEPSLLADRIIQVFRSDSLAGKIGESAHAHAAQRHDPQTVVHCLMQAYAAVLSDITERGSAPIAA